MFSVKLSEDMPFCLMLSRPKSYSPVGPTRCLVTAVTHGTDRRYGRQLTGPTMTGRDAAMQLGDVHRVAVVPVAFVHR